MKLRTAISIFLIFCAAVTSAAQNFNIAPSLRSHVDYLCCDSLAGRKAGSPGERAAADYVYRTLEASGVTMLTGREGQDFTITEPEGEIHSRNIVGIVNGYDEKLRNEYILVGAHMDNLGAVTSTVNGEKLTRLYPGADDNASGVAALLELAGLISANDFHFRRSIIFAVFGASECGLAGSWYFANRAFNDMGGIKAAVNLDMLGRGDDANPFRVFSSLDKQRLSYFMERTLDEPVITPPQIFGGTLQTSDHLPFYEKGIPVFVFTTGITREYRSINDVPSLVDCRRLERHCNYIFYFLKTLSSEENSDFAGLPASQAPQDGGGTIFSPADCDKRAQFFHSDEMHFLSAWVYKYLKYPDEAVDNGIQGKVMVSFVVEKNGKVSNVEVVRGVDELLDAEAIRVVKASPDWIPAKLKGKAVRTRITIPVEFRLSRTSGIGLKNGIRRKNR